MPSSALDGEQSQAIPMPLVAGEDARDEEEVGRGPSEGYGVSKGGLSAGSE